MIDDIASITDPVLILTGGEPLMRADIWDIVDYARERGCRTVMGTNGTMIDEETAAAIAAHGIPKVSVSLDFPTAEGQDRFRGQEGAFERTLAGIGALQRHGVAVQVNTTVTKLNRDQMDEMHDLAAGLGATDFHPFLLVPTGRGEDLVDVELTPQEYEEVLTWAYRRQRTSPMGFKPTDAPMYYRILRQQAKAEGIEVAPRTFGSAAHTRGCLGGISFVFISHTGDVQPCGYFDMQLGNVREVPFSRIWTESPVFDDLRHYERLEGKCGACEFKGVCGGCRARALALTGDYLAEEPYCAYRPARYVRERVLDVIQSDFPLETDPVAALAERLGFERGEVADALSALRREGTVRRVGASFDSCKLGWASTLCALAVPAERIDEVGALVAEYPAVTHDYRRDARYNLWFTLIVRDEDEKRRVLGDIVSRSGCADLLDLPAERLYKIRVDFGTGHRVAPAAPRAQDASPRAFDVDDAFDVALARWAQGDVLSDGDDGAAAERPYASGARAVSEQLGRPVSEEEVLTRLRELLDAGAIRRFGAIVRHQRMGYTDNAMVVFDVADALADEVGSAFSQRSCVSHCYRRPRGPKWPYNLYAMVHATNVAELDERVAELVADAEAVGALGCAFRVLVSSTEYKKTSMRYFD